MIGNRVTAFRALQVLRFDREPGRPMCWNDADWKRLIKWAGPAHLQLAIANRIAGGPAWVAEWASEQVAKNARRTDELRARLGELSEQLDRHGLPWLMLKGVTHAPDFVPAVEWRPQYDIDLFVPPHLAKRAFDAVCQIGYDTIADSPDLPTDHLPTLIRKTGWQWKGDYLDPEIPFAIEIHYRWWDAITEGFCLPRTEDFWQRRVQMEWRGVSFAALERCDRSAYAALHALRHLLRGDLRPSHLYEIAYLLDKSTSSHWHQWDQQDARIRKSAALMYALAQLWFGCRLPEPVVRDIDQLPAAQRAWVARFGFSPLTNEVKANKNELFLSLALADAQAVPAILRRRLLPHRLPGPIDDVHTPGVRPPWWRRTRNTWNYGAFLLRRLRHHCVAPIRTLLCLPAWCWGQWCERRVKSGL